MLDCIDSFTITTIKEEIFAMSKRIIAATFHLSLLISGSSVMASEGGPMNADWFYGENHPFQLANRLHQDRVWDGAAEEYSKVLQQDVGTEYDKQMAQLNMAACLMAQRQPSEGWGSFDLLLGIAKEQRISKELIESDQKDAKTVLVRTDKVGTGDIFHFLKSAAVLKEKTGWDVTISMRDHLARTLFDAVQSYGLKIVSEKDEQPDVDYVTHMIGLLGHLEMSPASMNPEKVMFTAPERAHHAVSEKVDPVLARGDTLAVVFLGEDRQATLIGGKQLPRDKAKHGRHLLSAPFVELLKKHKEVTLMDCGGQSSRVAIENGQEDSYMVIPDEEQPFDTIVALARIMSVKKRIVGFGADNGPTNVFARSLDAQAQDRMAFIIPNSEEYDMRMEGEGSAYEQMISGCRVYKCKSLKNLTSIVDIAYRQMTFGN